MDEGLLNDLLECSVCLERLDTSSRVLPCQHTFCLKCLKEIVQSHKELRCPECRILVEAKIEELPPNVLLMRILEGMRYPRRAPISADHPVTPAPALLGPATNPLALDASRRISQLQQQQHPPHVAANLFRDLHNLQVLNAQQQSRVYTDHSGKSIVNVPHARANFDFISKEPGDLSFKKGDIIYLRKKIDPYWYHGECGGKTGVFPINYAQVMVGLPSQSAQCKALYDFRMSAPDEEGCLAFDKGAIIKVMRRVDENWAEGRLGDRIGIFPIAFVDMNAPAKSLIKMSHNTAGSSRVAPPTPAPSTDSASRCSPRAVLDSSQAPYRYQPMSLSSPLPGCVSGVASNMSQSHPVYQHLPTQSKPTADLMQNTSNNFKYPNIAHSVQSPNVVPAENYDNTRLRSCKASSAYPNQLRQETVNSNTNVFTNISSDSSSSVTTPSHGHSSITTTPNTSSDTSSSESAGRSSPSSPENTHTEGNTSSVPSQYIPPSSNEPPMQSPIQKTHNNTQNKTTETSASGSMALEQSSGSPNVSFKQSDAINTSSPKNVNSSSSTMNDTNNDSAGLSKLDMLGISSLNISEPGPSISNVSLSQDLNNSGRNEKCQVTRNINNVKKDEATVSNLVSPTHSKNVSSRQWGVGTNAARASHTNRDKEKRHSLTPGTILHTQNPTPTQNRHSAEIIATSLLDHQPHNVSRNPDQVARDKHRTDRERERARERRRRRSGSGDRHSSGGSGTAYVPYIALYPYRPQKADELELKKGGIYVVTERCQDGWFKGRPAGCTMRPGVFPGNYVTPATVKSSASREQANRQLTIETITSCTGKIHQRDDKERCVPGVCSSNTVMVSHTPHLPPRAISPTALATTTPCFIWTSPQGTAKILEKPSKDKQTQRQDKNAAGVSLMKRLAAMKKCKSPPPTPTPPTYSMDNPVFEDCLPSNATHQPAHVRSGSCPSQLLQVLPTQSSVWERGESILGGSVSSAVGQRLFGAGVGSRGRGVKERPSVLTVGGKLHGGGVRTTASGAWVEQSSSHSHTTHHRKSQSLDAGDVLSTRRKESTTHTQTVKERFRCVVPYPANSSYELELQVDDVVLVHKKRGDGWYKGTLAKTGRTGLFPASFVQPISDAVPSIP